MGNRHGHVAEAHVSGDPGIKPGFDSSHATELQAAVDAALECVRNPVRFANDSEPVLNRLDRALRHLQQQKYTDERQIIDSLSNKEALAKFVLDCVRNRFILWKKVAEIRKMLMDGNKGWTSAFKAVQRTSPYDTVDLKQPESGPPAPPPPDRLPPINERAPIPFAIEAIALLGLLFPTLALAQGCSCSSRWILFAVGLILCVPCIAFEVLLLKRPLIVLKRFVVGCYAADVERRSLNCFWTPSSASYVAKKQDANSQGSDGQSSQWTSFGFWFCKPYAPEGAIVSLADSQFANVSSTSSLASASDADRPGSTLVKLSVVRLSSGALGRQQQIECQLHTDGTIVGMLERGKFTGSAIEFDAPKSGPTSETWAKLGSWRLDFVRKILSATAVVGLAMSLAAASVYPHLTFDCGPTYDTTIVSVHTPMEVVFLLDASSSMDDAAWSGEQEAVKTIIDAFVNVYRPEDSKVHVGITQFSSSTNVDVHLTNDLEGLVYPRLPPSGSLTQAGGLTDYGAALASCAQQLQQGVAGAYKVCVMTTDGSCNAASGKQCPDNSALRKTVTDVGAEFMGIYIGSESASSEESLKEIACGSGEPCKWFTSAEGYNFAQLKANAENIAESIVLDAQERQQKHEIVYTCGSPPLWTLNCLSLCVPFIVWWLYLRLSCVPTIPEVKPSRHKDPERLRVAGANKGAGADAKQPTSKPVGKSSARCLSWCRRRSSDGLASDSSV